MMTTLTLISRLFFYSASEQIDALTRSVNEKENTIQGLLAEGLFFCSSFY